MKQEVALNRLGRGNTCLWVGAGVGVQLSRGSYSVPTWDQLVRDLEAIACVDPPVGVSSYAARLDVLLSELRRKRFQRELRTRILHPIAGSIVDGWQNNRRMPPNEIVALAHLGFLANPIVNFNIETLTSQALVAGSGPWKPVVFKPPVPDALSSPSSSRGATDSKRHQRRVYHPHGSIDLSGICVMTERDYQSMNGTLALQLAVHAAFGLDLAIVGMSLEDKYLRDQIEQFRHQVLSINWFTSPSISSETAAWCYRTRVDIVQISWPEFWNAVASELPGPNPSWLAYEWIGLAMHALRLLGNPMTDSTNEILHGHEDDLAQKSDWLWHALMCGEDVKVAPRELGASVKDPTMEQMIQDQLEIVRNGLPPSA